jgi:peptidyl-prolyl cis-trans isomerase D
MLQLFHNFKKSYAIVLIVIVVVFAMFGFGIDFSGNRNQKNAAITVNGEEISYQEFARARENMEARYRQMLGENYAAFAGSLRLNQQIADTLIAGKLLQSFAKEIGLVPSRLAVKELLLSSGLFAKGYDENIYRSYLQQVGMSSAQFEGELEIQSLTNQFSDLIMQSTFASSVEVQEELLRQETSFDVELIKLEADKIQGSLKAPADDVLKKFYEDNSSDYETLPKVSYKFVSFDPSEWAKKAEILPEDIEFYYTENQRRYKLPEQVKVSRIQLNFGKSDNAEKMAELKTKADEVFAKAFAGESFDSLVQIYSDDYISKATGGDMGWVEKGSTKLPAEVLKAAFNLKVGEVSQVISTDSGYEVIKVTDKKDSEYKKLESVKGEIETQLRNEQGPAFAAAKAQDTFELWQKSGKDLEEFSKTGNLKLELVKEPMDASKDPAGMFRLTAEILKIPDLKTNIFEVGDKSVLVEITEYLPSEVPAFEKVKEEVLKAWKRAESRRLATESAREIIQDLEAGKLKDLSEAAKAKALKIEKTKGITRANPGAAPLSNPEIREEIFRTAKSLAAPKRYHLVGSDAYIVQVVGINRPTVDKVAGKVATQRTEESQRLGRLMINSIVNDLKARAEINIGAGIDLNG